MDVEKIKGLEETFRVRAGKYRIIFNVDSLENTIYVTHIEARKKAYEKIGWSTRFLLLLVFSRSSWAFFLEGNKFSFYRFKNFFNSRSPWKFQSDTSFANVDCQRKATRSSWELISQFLIRLFLVVFLVEKFIIVDFLWQKCVVMFRYSSFHVVWGVWWQHRKNFSLLFRRLLYHQFVLRFFSEVPLSVCFKHLLNDIDHTGTDEVS